MILRVSVELSLGITSHDIIILLDVMDKIMNLFMKYPNSDIHVYNQEN